MLKTEAKVDFSWRTDPSNTHQAKEWHYTRSDFMKDITFDINEFPSCWHVFCQLVLQKPDDVCLYAPNDTNSDYLEVTFKDMMDWHLRVCGRLMTDPSLSCLFEDESENTVALLHSDNESFLGLQHALYGTNNNLVLLSPRNSSAGIKYLCEATNCTHLICDERCRPLTGLLENISVSIVGSFRFCQRSEWPIRTYKSPVSHAEDLFKIKLYLHSSGSTRHPKPVGHTNFFTLATALRTTTPYCREMYRNGAAVILCQGPMFHAFGLYATYLPSITGGYVAALPLSSSYIPSPSSMFRAIELLAPQQFQTVPILLEALLDYCEAHPSRLKVLRRLEDCMYGGAHIPPSTAERFKKLRIPLTTVYGSTEVGVVAAGGHLTPETGSVQHDYMDVEMLWFQSWRWLPIEGEPDMYQLLINDDSVTFLESERNHPDGFATHDIFRDTGHAWNYVGRLDDTIVHNTGEKTNALALEHALKSHSSFIQAACVIGNNQPCTAALVQLHWDRVNDVSLNEVWIDIFKAVDRANASVPSHSRLGHKMVKIVPAKSLLPMGLKGSVQRNIVNDQFAFMISEMFEAGSGPGARENSQESLISAFAQMLDVSEDDLKAKKSESFFKLGVDSQTTQEIHGLIEKFAGRKLPASFLYEHSSLNDIVHQLNLSNIGELGKLKSRRSLPRTAALEIKSKFQQEIDHIANFMEFAADDHWPQWKPRTFIVTGAAGSLGCQIVAALLSRCEVATVYAFIRGNDPQQRLLDSSEKRGLGAVMSENLCAGRLQVVQWSMAEKCTDLADMELRRLLKLTVTDIVMNAWKVDFNLSVNEFEQDCLKSILNFIEFAVTPCCPRKRLHFVSSLSAVSEYSGGEPTIPELFPGAVEYAWPLGYGLSKSLGESFISHAGKMLNLSSNVFRCGQLGGDWRKGVWNQRELIPMLSAQGAGVLHAVPQIDFPCDFVPIDIAANAIVDIAMDTIPSPGESSVFHVANPNGGTWQTWLSALREVGLRFDIVTNETFLQILDQHPRLSLTLLKPFLERLRESPVSNQKFPELTKSLAASPSLRECPPVDATMAGKYIESWRASGFMP